MALHMNVRVRLDLRDAISKLKFSFVNPLCWISVNKTNIVDIRGLKALIKTRYNISEDVHFQLLLQNYLLPDSEPIDLLRDDDLLKCVLDSNTQEQQNSAYNLNSNKICTLTNEASKKRKPEEDNDSSFILEETDFSQETVASDKREKRKKRKSEAQTEKNHEEKNVNNDNETAIIPVCSPLDSKSTEREELLKMLNRIRDFPKKTKASCEKPPDRKHKSSHHILRLADIPANNSSGHIEKSVLQTEEETAALKDGIASAAKKTKASVEKPPEIKHNSSHILRLADILANSSGHIEKSVLQTEEETATLKDGIASSAKKTKASAEKPPERKHTSSHILRLADIPAYNSSGHIKKSVLQTEEETAALKDGITSAAKKTKTSAENPPERQHKSSHILRLADILANNSSGHIEKSVLQTEEETAALKDVITSAACTNNILTVSNLDTSYNSRKTSDTELGNSFESFENTIKLQKKKRKRRRKNKCPKELPISTLPFIPCESTPVCSSDAGFQNRMSKHIRFDDTNSSFVATESQSKNQHTEEQNNPEELIDVAVNQVQESEIMTSPSGQTNMKHYKELSKDKQINSVCTNKSIILLNCFGSYPDGKNILNNSSTVETLNQNTSTPVKSVVTTKPKYEDYPQLKGPPRIGDHIAFKILELSETYCPEVSQFKEGKVVKCENDMLDVKLFGYVKKKSNKGKFELVYSDEENRTERTWNDNEVQISWSDMIEPRLLNTP